MGEAEYVDFLYDYFDVKAGDEGYYVLPFECVKEGKYYAYPRFKTEGLILLLLMK